MRPVKANRQQVLLPAIFSAGSFFCIGLLMMLTSPVEKIAYAVLFFGLLTVFLVSLGYLFTLLQAGQVSRRSRGRILSLSVFVLLAVMFRSAGSLSWVGGLILVLIVAGLLFYGSHRA